MVRTVERFELPNLHALNFLLHDALDGGGTISLKTDAQGKVYSGPARDGDPCPGRLRMTPAGSRSTGPTSGTRSAPLIDALREALDQRADPSVRVVVFAGRGTTSAPAPTSNRSSACFGPSRENLADARSPRRAVPRHARLTRAHVAAVRGRALAGGSGLATACDIVLAADSANSATRK